MTLEDFKDVYKDKSPLEKLKLLLVQEDYIRDDVRSLERDKINGNEKGADYLRREIQAKEDRIRWLFEQLEKLLKAQEPRTMTLEEVREKKPFCLWVEDLDTGAIVFPVACIDGEYEDRTLDWCVCIDLAVASEDYGVRWRFWTSRPTDAQRKAVKWDD